MMNLWQEEYLNSLQNIDSEQELFGKIVALAKGMGFDFCGYGIQMSVPISRPFVACFDNFSNGNWNACMEDRASYLKEESNQIDSSSQPSPLEFPQQSVFVNDPEKWDEARERGLHFGWTVFARDASGSTGRLTLARVVKDMTEYDLFENKIKMTWLAQFSHASMARLIVPKFAPEILISMTIREKEVLRWTAEGKTAYEIGQILSVSERTVNFHINNVVTKLAASNKTQAAVKATALGLLA